jgi:glycosyltransferase involved in cell wall biosynthesis
MAAPEVSVVIPCYKAEQYVLATVRSVLAQGVPTEIIVVDDGSPDRSVEVLQRSGLPLTVLRQPNQGVAAARNAGVAAARSRWIAFVDADDIWLPGKLEAQLNLLERSSGARMAYSAWHVWPSIVAEPDQELLAALRRELDSPERWQGPSGDIYPELLQDCAVWTSTVVVDRELFQQVGGFDAGLRIGEDYDLWLRLSRVTPILRVPAPLALYRMHPTSITKRVVDRNHKGEVVDRALRLWGYQSAFGRSADKAAVDRGLARSWADHAGALLLAGMKGPARRAAICSLRSHARQMLGWKVLLKSLAPVTSAHQ